MKSNRLVVMIAIFWGTCLLAANQESIKHLNWGPDVIWLEDERFPIYNISIYFADGSLSDLHQRRGETEFMFSLLDTGTNRFNHKQISDSLEYYGASYSAYVSHEYSTYNISGLAKDVIPTMKMICHLFQETTFPEDELKKVQTRVKSDLENIVSSHSQLASLIFRRTSLKGTPYEFSSSATLKTVRNIKTRNLREKLSYFRNQVKKKIYISGPKSIEAVKTILTEDCGFKGQAEFVRSEPSFKFNKPQSSKPFIVLVPVPHINQAQIRIGRFLAPAEVKEHDLLTISSGYLGGGYTSLLNKEARINRGLTYVIGATAGLQKFYGRSVIRTSTKNSSVLEMINVIKETIEKAAAGQYPVGELKRAISHQAGSYLFKFEDNNAYLSNLVYFDHIGRSYEDLYRFPEVIKTFSAEQIYQKIRQIYNWPEQVIVIVGPASLKKELESIGPVQIKNYKEFL